MQLYINQSLVAHVDGLKSYDCEASDFKSQ